jgi:hypothetical protein
MIANCLPNLLHCLSHSTAVHLLPKPIHLLGIRSVCEFTFSTCSARLFRFDLCTANKSRLSHYFNPKALTDSHSDFAFIAIRLDHISFSCKLNSLLPLPLSVSFFKQILNCRSKLIKITSFLPPNLASSLSPFP